MEEDEASFQTFSEDLASEDLADSSSPHLHRRNLYILLILVYLILEATLGETGSNIPQPVINLSGRASHDQTDNGILGHPNIPVGSEDVDLAVSQDDTGTAGVFDGVAGLSVLTGETADGTGHVLPVQSLDILDLERVHEHVLETEQNHSILENNNISFL